MYLNCNAVVLRKYRYSETSYILHLLTREYGRVNALAKGARRLNSRMYSHFDLYNHEEITLYRNMRSELDLATSASLVREYSVLRKSVEVFACAGVLAEIILKSCMLYDKHEITFAAFTGFLESAEKLSPKLVISEFIADLWLILRDLGFEPLLGACVGCGEINPDSFTLDPHAGGIVCAQCRSIPQKMLLNPGILAGLRKVAVKQAGERINLSVNGAVLNVLSDYINYVLAADCVSFKVIKRLVG